MLLLLVLLLLLLCCCCCCFCFCAAAAAFVLLVLHFVLLQLLVLVLVLLLHLACISLPSTGTPSTRTIMSPAFTAAAAGPPTATCGRAQRRGFALAPHSGSSQQTLEGAGRI